MMSSSFLKATAAVATMAVVAVLAATAEAAGGLVYYIPTPSTPEFLLSPVFLWVTANVIIVWLVSSSRRRGRAPANDDETTAHDGEAVVVPGAVDSFYASEYEAFSDAPVSKKLQAREARAARRSDRPRVRKKPSEQAAGQVDAPTAPPWATVVAVGERDDERRVRCQEETPDAVTVAASADDFAESRPIRAAVDVDDDEDVSMDSLWASIVQRRAARPVVVQKSESWSNEELPRLERVAETAAAARRQVRKSVSAAGKASAVAQAPTTTQPAAPPAPAPWTAVRQMGWRTRDVLVTISPDDLLRRAESFIRRQREHLRLQRQESEQRQVLLQRRLHGGPAPVPLIRV